ncbi:hypothetical protein ET445_11190 [Agromyces protaetiae]|uniref:DUF2076 domain-containing protein n=1 Tax=Agromyces protaetiae TaxID=2509455 RepID=A0A4P6FIL9_9MICO|nr:hypothetical protein [Agromyces protaetiae]QAY73827.1 hypothetical protein ET445_11190 [Agromyces protaetiae]
MGFLDRIFGAPDPEPARPPTPSQRRLTDDELAVERYRYLLRTAPPESIEQVHAEAFARLTPPQRALVFQALSDQAPAGERLVSDEPSALARAATRQEMRQPGSVERAFASADVSAGRPSAGGVGYGGPSIGGMFGSSLLGTIAGVVVGTAIAQAFLPDHAFFEQGAEDSGEGVGDGGADASAAPESYGYDDSDHRWGDGGNPDDGFFGGGFDGGGFDI